LVAGILSRFGNEIDELTILPSSGGVYNIWKDSVLIFSKKELGRFPHTDDEVIDQLG
jgi:selenoprotein W-related protein